MAINAGYFSLRSLYRLNRPIYLIPYRPDQSISWLYFFVYLYRNSSRSRCLSTFTESQFAGKNAYDLLGVSANSSFADIKSSFRKLAKKTHPDLAQSPNDSSASQRFVQILAAYEILSDSEKRSHYDRYLLSQRTVVQRHSEQNYTIYKYESHSSTMKTMEVVEWLRWYRHAISEIVSEQRVVVGTSYFDILERDFYSAIHTAYYGPELDSMDYLPDSFEAEERSIYETSEVLHLVSGRDLFGMISISDKPLKIAHRHQEKMLPLGPEGSGSFQCAEMHTSSCNDKSDAYKDLELLVYGKVVGVATRVPPKSCRNGIKNEDSHDQIHIFLNSNDYTSESRIQLGIITGLGTSSEEGSCIVYNNSGVKTHVIMKHRTLLVKHLHWYEIGEKSSVCECRCTRARLPPSRYWLFEPRCELHDIGGWYVETYGRDKKGRNSPCQRFWDGFTDEPSEKRLHPAMYLLTLAYRTLDIEDAKRRKQTIKGIFQGQMFRVVSWGKKYI